MRAKFMIGLTGLLGFLVGACGQADGRRASPEAANRPEGEVATVGEANAPDPAVASRTIGGLRLEPFATGRWGCEVSGGATLGSRRFYVDNEQEKRIFELAEGVVPHTESARKLDLRLGEGKVEVGDIEAVAAWDGEIALVGSMSRAAGKLCVVEEFRHQIAWGRPGDGVFELTRLSQLGGRGRLGHRCLGDLLPEDPPEGDDHSRLCGLFASAEIAVEEGIDGSEKELRRICETSLNIEGAVVVEGRLWLGLRAPLDPERGAPLLRVADSAFGPAVDPGLLRFDAVAWVHIGGPLPMGIRELSPLGADLWVLGGPSGDAPSLAPDHAVLGSLPLSSLQPGARLSLSPRHTLPAGAEGLLRGKGVWHVLFDGKKPGKEDAAHCKEPAWVATLPDGEGG